MKFDSALAKVLYADLLDGFCDDECGTLAENGIVYYLFSEWSDGTATPIHVILSEDHEGNVFADSYANKESVLHAWDEQYQALEQDAEPLTLEEDDDD
jgi:hypothetical protein